MAGEDPGRQLMANDRAARALTIGVPHPRWTPHSNADLPALDMAQILGILWHRRWLILAFIIGGLVTAGVLTLIQPRQYRADVTLEVNPPAVDVLGDEGRGAQPVEHSWDQIATQVGLLSSHAMAAATARDSGLARDPGFAGGASAQERARNAADRIAGGIRVTMPEEGRLIRFSYADSDPQRAARIANQHATSFINATLQRRFDASAYAKAFLEKQIITTRAELEKSERALVAYAQQQGIITTGVGEDGRSPADTASVPGASLMALNQALAEATARRVAAEGAWRAGESVGATSEVAASAGVLRQQRAGLQSQYQEKLSQYKPDYPEMLALKAQIDELSRAIDGETSRAASGRRNTLLADYRAALSAEGALRARVAGLKGEVLGQRGRSVQYNILQREVDTNRSQYDALLQRLKQVGVAGGIGVSPVSIVDRAAVPTTPFAPRPLFNTALGGLAGLLAGLALALGIDIFNDRIRTRADVRTKLDLACLGVVPRLGRRDMFIDAVSDPASSVSEAYAGVVAAMRYATDQGLPRALMVTSTMAGEGKSSTSLALAQALARRGSRVLLIDGDLRKPSFVAGEGGQGLSTALIGERPHLSDHLVATRHEGLWLMPSGPIPPNPADLLASPHLAALIADARQRFDLVLIDAPPVTGLSDTVMIGSHVDGALLVVESGKARTRPAQEAVATLQANGVPLFGALLNKSSAVAEGYGYRYPDYGRAAIAHSRSKIELIPAARDHPVT